ncbi:MAG: hypothetical protein ACRDE2_00185 [Chitinophagaceae bacterium]
MAKKNKNNKRSPNSSLGLIRFNKVVNQARKELKKQNITLSAKELTHYTSLYIYPHLKKTPTYKLFNTVLAKETLKALKHIPPSDIDFVPNNDNVDYLNWGDFILVEFFELEEIIKNILPKELTIQINAGQLGMVPFFKVKDWKKVRSEWLEVLEEIRGIAQTTENPGGASGKFWFVPFLFHLKDKPNNKSIRNNGISFRLMSDDYGEIFKKEKLVDSNQMAIEPKGSRKKGTKKRNLAEKLKDIQKKKRKQFKEKETLLKKYGKNPKALNTISEISKNNLRIQRSIERETKQLMDAFKMGIYTAKEFKDERDKILKRYFKK